MNIGLTLDAGWLNPIPPNASQQQQVAVINEIINTLNSLTRTQIYSDDTTKRWLIGYQLNGWGTNKSFGQKLSRPGIDVTKATDEQLLFSMSEDEWVWRNDAGEIIKRFNSSLGQEELFNNGNAYLTTNPTGSTWKNSSGDVVKQFVNETGTDSYYEAGRNYVNIGLRDSLSTYGFEMAKPSQALDNEPF